METNRRLTKKEINDQLEIVRSNIKFSKEDIEDIYKKEDGSRKQDDDLTEIEKKEVSRLNKLIAEYNNKIEELTRLKKHTLEAEPEDEFEDAIDDPNLAADSEVNHNPGSNPAVNNIPMPERNAEDVQIIVDRFETQRQKMIEGFRNAESGELKNIFSKTVDKLTELMKELKSLIPKFDAAQRSNNAELAHNIDNNIQRVTIQITNLVKQAEVEIKDQLGREKINVESMKQRRKLVDRINHIIEDKGLALKNSEEDTHLDKFVNNELATITTLLNDETRMLPSRVVTVLEKKANHIEASIDRARQIINVDNPKIDLIKINQNLSNPAVVRNQTRVLQENLQGDFALVRSPNNLYFFNKKFGHLFSLNLSNEQLQNIDNIKPNDQDQNVTVATMRDGARISLTPDHIDEFRTAANRSIKDMVSETQTVILGNKLSDLDKAPYNLAEKLEALPNFKRIENTILYCEAKVFSNNERERTKALELLDHTKVSLLAYKDLESEFLKNREDTFDNLPKKTWSETKKFNNYVAAHKLKVNSAHKLLERISYIEEDKYANKILNISTKSAIIKKAEANQALDDPYAMNRGSPKFNFTSSQTDRSYATLTTKGKSDYLKTQSKLTDNTARLDVISITTSSLFSSKKSEVKVHTVTKQEADKLVSQMMKDTTKLSKMSQKDLLKIAAVYVENYMQELGDSHRTLLLLDAVDPAARMNPKLALTIEIYCLAKGYDIENQIPVSKSFSSAAVKALRVKEARALLQKDPMYFYNQAVGLAPLDPKDIPKELSPDEKELTENARTPGMHRS